MRNKRVHWCIYWCAARMVCWTCSTYSTFSNTYIWECLYWRPSDCPFVYGYIESLISICTKYHCADWFRIFCPWSYKLACWLPKHNNTTIQPYLKYLHIVFDQAHEQNNAVVKWKWWYFRFNRRSISSKTMDGNIWGKYAFWWMFSFVLKWTGKEAITSCK